VFVGAGKAFSALRNPLPFAPSIGSWLTTFCGTEWSEFMEVVMPVFPIGWDGSVNVVVGCVDVSGAALDLSKLVFATGMMISLFCAPNIIVSKFTPSAWLIVGPGMNAAGSLYVDFSTGREMSKGGEPIASIR